MNHLGHHNYNSKNDEKMNLSNIEKTQDFKAKEQTFRIRKIF